MGSAGAGLLQAAAERLAVCDDHPRLTAQALMAHVMGVDRAWLLAHPARQPTPEQAERFQQLADRAARGEPLAYLTGRREFYGLDFEVDARVLVPRPETELLVDLAAAARPQRIVEVGTGSGCIAVALAVRLPQAHIAAGDIAADGLDVARRNAERHGVAERIHFAQGDLLEAFLAPAAGAGQTTAALPAAFFPCDLLVANLPYIDSHELARLPVARHEPRLALDGGPGGLVLVDRLLAQAAAARAVGPGGQILLEIGAGQGAAAAALARSAWPLAAVSIKRDLAGLERVLAIRLAAQPDGDANAMSPVQPDPGRP
jgi:release factor glutamine methyltransferase